MAYRDARKYQITRNRVQPQNRLEALVEEAHIKVSSLMFRMWGRSGGIFRRLDWSICVEPNDNI
jgi:hypothetical protein